MYRYILVLMTLVLAGCSTTGVRESKTKIALVDTDKATVLFKTVEKDIWTGRGVGGFVVKFQNKNTGKVYINRKGIMGSISQKHYKLSLEPGTYELKEVFFYNGFMNPIEKPFEVTVGKGEVAYIGTLSKSTRFPEPQYKLSQILSYKEYRRNDCILFGPCYVYGDVAVIDEKIKASDFGIELSAGSKLIKRLLK